MAEFTITDLASLLRQCAGEDESIDLDGQDILDMTFEDLGYDSLALHNTVNRIEREQAFRLSDEVVVEAKTPRALLDEINERLAQSA
jgi:act minimal PKS acyl carrier protein